MFRNLFKKLVGVGLALCLVGGIVFAGPGVMVEVEDGVAPFFTLVPDDADDD